MKTAFKTKVVKSRIRDAGSRDKAVSSTPIELKEQDDGSLSEIQVPPGYYALKNQALRKHSIMIFEMIRQSYGGNLVSYQDLLSIKPHWMAAPQFSLVLCSLWAHGHLRKFARGKFNNGYLSKNSGKVGKYYGVHYQIKERNEDDA